jgi:hypothetical protein
VVVFNVFSMLARLVHYLVHSFVIRWRDAPSNKEWMLDMQANVTKIIATMVVFALFAAGAAVAEDKDAAARTAAVTTTDTADLNRNRARSANIAAAEDAIEAVRAANKLRLDIRLIDRTSVQVADSR